MLVRIFTGFARALPFNLRFFAEIEDAQDWLNDTTKSAA